MLIDAYIFSGVDPLRDNVLRCLALCIEGTGNRREDCGEDEGVCGVVCEGDDGVRGK